MKKIFLSILFLSVFTFLYAQFVLDYLKAGNDYFSKGDYSSAAEYYEKFIDGSKADGKDEYSPYTPQTPTRKKSKSETSRETAIYKLAECYRLLNYPEKALPHYETAMSFNKTDFPLTQFHLASQLRALGKFNEAATNYQQFLSGYQQQDLYRQNAQREIQNLDFIKTQLNKKDLKYYSVVKAPAELNTTGASYAPAWIDEQTILFTSTRPVGAAAKNNVYSNRLYTASFINGSVSEVKPAEMPQDKDLQQGVGSITPDGNTIYLTKWGISGGKKTAAIYISRKTADGWSEPEKLESSVNETGSSSQQPFVTMDGKYLLYTSNKSGGKGGLDIWYAPLVDGKPGSSVNMGDAINTSADEQAPSYHEASQSLVFSTNGRIGMGGFDFFISKGNFSTWGQPENLGYPVNSVKDDLYFISRGSAKNILDDVVFSSDRDAACCLELFTLKKVIPARQIAGSVVSCDDKKPLQGATVSFINPANNSTVLVKTTGADGTYSFTLDEYLPLRAVASLSGYQDGSIQFNAPADPESIIMNNPAICLKLIEFKPVETVEVLENIYFDYDKATLKEESFPTLDDLAAKLLRNPAVVIELSGHTDSRGRDNYNMKLSQARATSCVEYLVSKGVKPEQLKAKGYGETKPVEPNTNKDGSDNPEGRAKNRRIEFKVLKNE